MVSEKGVAITGAQAVLRNLVGVVDGWLPFCYLIGLSSMILSGRFQRVGDLAAGTIVMIEERRARRPIARVNGPEVEALLEWLPRRVAAGPKLARVVSDYVDQRSRFTPPSAPRWANTSPGRFERDTPSPQTSRPISFFVHFIPAFFWAIKMRVADRLRQRETTWRELDLLVARFGKGFWRRPSADQVLRLGELYRAVCTDLMLAEEYDLPRDTVSYLQSLVGRATTPSTVPQAFMPGIGAGPFSRQHRRSFDRTPLCGSPRWHSGELY